MTLKTIGYENNIYDPTLKKLGNDLLWSLCAFGLALCVTALSIFSHILNPFFAILVCFSLSFLAAWKAPGMAFVLIIFAAVFQNLFVSLISPDLKSETDFNIARGYSFIILSAVWLVAFLTWLFAFYGKNQILDRLMKITTMVFFLIGFYFLFGFIQNPLGSIIYLRSIGSAFMFFQIGLVFFTLHAIRLTHILSFLAFTLAILGYIEFFYRTEWMDLTNGQAFWDLSTTKQRESSIWDKQARETGIVVKGFIDSITIDLFNTPLLDAFKIQIVRLLGPNFHAISYAYALGFFLIFSLYRGAFLMTSLLLPLLLLTNAKGAVIVLLLVSGAWFALRFFGTRFAIISLFAILTLYIVAGIIIGLKIGDFHVLGFMGGVHNFLGNPLGHGLGSGGNLSTNFSDLDWSDYQAAGRTPIAVESAVGVMLFQMGIAAFFYFAVVIWIALKTISLGARTGFSLHSIAGFGLITILVNGVFQEEALFSPSALGLFMALNGIILGAAIRTGALDFDKTDNQTFA